MRHILFIELLGGLGDVLIALPAMQALAAAHPEAQLTVLTFAPGGDLLHHHPLIHRVIQVSQGTARQAVKQALAEVTYDLVVTDTTYDGIADLISQSDALRTVTNLWRTPPADQRVSDRFLAILHAEGLIPAAADPCPRLYFTPSERVLLPTDSRPNLCLYPDAGMAIKRWSPEHFISLGQQLQPHFNIYVPEGTNAGLAGAIAQHIPNARPWPSSTLRQFTAFLRNTHALVAADTGPAHIAAALGIPTVTLFGPSWRLRYGQPPPHVNLQAFPDCPERRVNFTEQVCWYSGKCPYAWRSCVDLIAPGQVAALLLAELAPLPLGWPKAGGKT